ncbi:hypothetical protein ACVJ19_008140 [Bradyrhizobium sp. USDA 376]
MSLNVVLAKARSHYPRETFGEDREFGTTITRHR